MKLFYKTLKELNRSMYLYYPQGSNRNPWKYCSITVLREEEDEASVLRLLFETGLAELAEKQHIILSFPNPVKQHWNYDFEGETDDIHSFPLFQEAMTKQDDEPLERLPNGIPTYEAMMSTWHPMNDTKYLIGIRSGAKLACTLAACYPDNIAAVLCINGDLCEEALNRAVYSPVPASLVNCTERTGKYFIRANGADLIEENEKRKIYKNKINPLQCVVEDNSGVKLNRSMMDKVWQRMFQTVRRTNTGAHGDCEPRINLAEAGFEYYLEDDRLEERVKTKHTWFTHVPNCVKTNPVKKVPLMLFFHGGSDNPEEAAQMSRFHELGEKEGFITVYPWGTNKTQWNSDMSEEGADDTGFVVSLIQYMIRNYPVDEKRVYLSGFSNGAAHAQTVAMTHPELIAAICHIDSNWPGTRMGASEIRYEDITPMRLAWEKKKDYDYRMPVWYTYGSREISYPVYRGCSQQHQYDFWKKYNNIMIMPTPGIENPDPCGCGVLGQSYELLKPSKRHPHHEYDVQRFFTMDKEPKNYYNYVVMRDKGHEVADMDPALGWSYVKQFCRMPDGSVGMVMEGE